MKPVKAIRHTGIVVKDMETMAHFYRDILGMKEVRNFREEGNYIDSILGLKGVKLWMIKLVAEDNSMIELLKYESHPKDPQTNEALNNLGCNHVAFTVENIDETYRTLNENGVRFTCPPYLSPDGYAKVTFCQDPEGSFIELVEVVKS